VARPSRSAAAARTSAHRAGSLRRIGNGGAFALARSLRGIGFLGTKKQVFGRRHQDTQANIFYRLAKCAARAHTFMSAGAFAKTGPALAGESVRSLASVPYSLAALGSVTYT
jgi:hypothetical protein